MGSVIVKIPFSYLEVIFAVENIALDFHVDIGRHPSLAPRALRDPALPFTRSRSTIASYSLHPYSGQIPNASHNKKRLSGIPLMLANANTGARRPARCLATNTSTEPCRANIRSSFARRLSGSSLRKSGFSNAAVPSPREAW